MITAPSIDKLNAYEFAADSLTEKLTVWAKAAAPSDLHLAAVLAAWATLPETTKASVVAMITSYPQ